MDILEWYFGFHPRESVFSAIKSRRWSFFQHVEAWGYTKDGTWLFFDPQAVGSKVYVTHHADDVDEMFGRRLEICESVLRSASFSTGLTLPIHPTMNCAAQCAHLIGVRAYTPRHLMRILHRNNAVEIKDGPKGKRRVESGSYSGA